MPGRFKIMLTVILFPFAFFDGKAQYRFDKAVRIAEENGLSSNDVRNIHLSPDGFVWIATGDGLSRFDGKAVRSFAHNNDDPSTIFPGVVNTVLTWRKEIWSATTKGISVLDPATEKFRH